MWWPLQILTDSNLFYLLHFGLVAFTWFLESPELKLVMRKGSIRGTQTFIWGLFEWLELYHQGGEPLPRDPCSQQYNLCWNNSTPGGKLIQKDHCKWPPLLIPNHGLYVQGSPEQNQYLLNLVHPHLLSEASNVDSSGKPSMLRSAELWTKVGLCAQILRAFLSYPFFPAAGHFIPGCFWRESDPDRGLSREPPRRKMKPSVEQEAIHAPAVDAVCCRHIWVQTQIDAGTFFFFALLCCGLFCLSQQQFILWGKGKKEKLLEGFKFSYLQKAFLQLLSNLAGL